MTDAPATDPTVRRIRECISAADDAILDAVNARLRLVAELKEHKAARGYPVEDRGREDDLIARLTARNAGPLSPEGVSELFRLLIAIGKRDVYRLGR